MVITKQKQENKITSIMDDSLMMDIVCHIP